MRLLDRYLLREVLVPLAFCLSGILIFMICFDMFRMLDKFHSNHLQLLDIAAYYAVRLPEFIVTILPITLLLSLLYALTNHSRHNELTAIRAAGVSLWRMCAVYFAVGFAASIALAVVNEFWAPDSNTRSERILNRRIQPATPIAAQDIQVNLGFSNGRDHRKWHIGTYNVITSEMTDPKIDWRMPDGSERELIARRAVWTNNAWTFFDVMENIYAPDSGKITNRVIIPARRWTDLTETPEVIKSEIRIRSHLSRLSGNADLPIADLLYFLRLHPDLTPKAAAQLHTRLQGRFAAPWTCMVVILIAIPFGAASGRRNVFVGVASSIVICFAYFVFQQGSMALGAGGYLPPWLAAWAPNITASVVGLWLGARMR
jgi:lipopolysaccharide export system permease protein